MVKYLVILILCSVLSPLQASEVIDHYQGLVEVDSRSQGDRQGGIRRALNQVLIRITGHDDVATDPVARSVLSRSNQYLLTYGYQGSNPLYLSVRFDANKLALDLRDSRLPIWGEQRPTTLLWVVQQGELGQSNFVEQDSELAQLFKQQASLRGLPLSWPLYDLQDSIEVEVNDVWGQFIRPVNQASLRYENDFFAVNRFYLVDDKWHYHSQLYQPLKTSWGIHRNLASFEGVAASESDAVNGLLVQLGRYYSDRYGVLASDQGEALLEFSLSGDISDLVELERFLDSLPSVVSLVLVKLDKNVVSYRIQSAGRREQLNQALLLDDRVSQSNLSTLNGPLYRWKDHIN